MLIYFKSIVFVVMLSCGCSPKGDGQKVVVYTSVDDTYSRQVAEKFQVATGVKVLLVTDTEETKSTGLVNRLIAEKSRPQADVFWSGDPVRTALLKKRGVTTSYKSPAASPRQLAMGDDENHYTALSARLRVLIYNRALVSSDQIPQTIFDLTNSAFRGRACIANPLFGTTSMHVAAFIQSWGEDAARNFFSALSSNQVAMLSSNGEVKRRVGAGDFAFGITDTDDVSVALQDGKPVGWVIPDQSDLGALLIPNAVCLIKGGPNVENARKFIDYLLSKEVEQMLADSVAVQLPLREALSAPKFFPQPLDKIRTMSVNYSKLAEGMELLPDSFVGKWVQERMDSKRDSVNP